jgi:hypothetical protein
MPSFRSGSDSQASLLIRLHLTSAYLVMNGLSQRVNCPFLPNLFVRVLALRKFHFSLRSDRVRINPVAFPSTAATPAPCSQLASPAPASRRSGASKQNVRLAASCDRASPHHDPTGGVPTRDTHYAKVDRYDSVAGPCRQFGGDRTDCWSAAIAQTAGSRNPVAPPLRNSAQQLLPEAPVGLRQPRADQVRSEKNLMDPSDPVNSTV